MSELITTIFDSFNTVINGLSGGLKGAFNNLIYVDPAATDPVISPMVLFIFTMFGLGLASGILYKIFGMIRSRGGR